MFHSSPKHHAYEMRGSGSTNASHYTPQAYALSQNVVNEHFIGPGFSRSFFI